MSGNGFALPEYVVPQSALGRTIPLGTMPKASTEHGTMLGEVRRMAKLPSPDQYNKDFLNQSFAQTARGGGFSRLAREYGKGGLKTPAVGQYEAGSAQTTPRLRGGVLSKTDRGCIFFDQATTEGRWKQGPGKYDGKRLEVHRRCPIMQTNKTDARSPRKPNPVGPGYYSLEYKQVETRVPSYSGSKGDSNSFLEKHVKGKEKVPGPGHNGFPEAKNEDRAGRHLHSQRLLGDRVVSPRFPVAGSDAG